MLDEGPRQTPFDPPQRDLPAPDPGETAPVEGATIPATAAGPATATGPGSVAGPATATIIGLAAATSAAPSEASGAALLAADVRDAWEGLEPTSRFLFGTCAAAFVIVLIGLPLSVWDSAPFALLVMAATIVTAVTAWFGSNAAWRSLPIPVPTIELMATHVVAVLAVFKLTEVLFHLATESIVGLLIAGALVVAAGALLVAAQRRGVTPLGSMLSGDRWTRIAAIGLVFVLLGWAFNLSVSFWTMGQAALPLAVATLAALTVSEALRIQSPVPVAWIGAGIAVFGALLALGNWGELTTLGRTEIELDPVDFLGLVTYSVGVALLIAGGVMSGRSQWAARHPSAPGPIVEG